MRHEVGQMKIGDLVKYMSRIVLVTGFDTQDATARLGTRWAYGIELDDDRAMVGKYRKSALKVIK